MFRRAARRRRSVSSTRCSPVWLATAASIRRRRSRGWTPNAIRALAGLSYAKAAARIVAPFVGDDLTRGELEAMAEDAYRGFRHAAKAPLVQIDDNLFLLELFHGPTLAFKDFAMQWLGRLMNHALARRDAARDHSSARPPATPARPRSRRSAAASADRRLHSLPAWARVRRAAPADDDGRQARVHAIAIDGSFDDCQDIVKALFNDLALPRRTRRLPASIRSTGRASSRRSSIISPPPSRSARRIAKSRSPCRPAISATSGGLLRQADGAADRSADRRHQRERHSRARAGQRRLQAAGRRPTQSPSMDIQVSSNFERLLFEAYGRDAARGARADGQPAAVRRVHDPPEPLAAIRRDFDAVRVSETECEGGDRLRLSRRAASRSTRTPRSASYAARAALRRDPSTPVVALATAHPAKFPDAVERATGERPPLPPHMRAILDARGALRACCRTTRPPSRDFVRAHARATA